MVDKYRKHFGFCWNTIEYVAKSNEKLYFTLLNFYIFLIQKKQVLVKYKLIEKIFHQQKVYRENILSRKKIMDIKFEKKIIK